MKNGSLIFGVTVTSGTSNTTAGLLTADFIGDELRRKSSGSVNNVRGVPVAESNNNPVLQLVTSDPLISTIINDIAVTVLPNAPIDATTGLPVSTIAVATDSGVSVIKDDGTVANMQRGSNETGTIAFDDNYDLIFSWGTTANAHRHITRLLAPWSSFDNSTTFTNNYLYSSAAGGSTAGVVKVGNSGRHFGIDYDSTGGGNTDDRLLTIAPLNTSDTQMDMTNFITSNYNTGWMNGDIKLATLSDTDTANVTGADLVTNGTFASNTTGWLGSSGATLSLVSNTMEVTGVGYGSQAITTVVGKVYVVAYDYIRVGGINGKLYIATTNSGGDVVATGALSSSGSYATTFTAVSTTTYLNFRTDSSGDTRWDNISCRLAEEDRSVNGNGVQVFGTVTKTAVATGAELMGYSGFSSANYLMQPYNC